MRKSNTEKTKLLYTVMVSLAIVIGLVVFLRSGSFFSQGPDNPQVTQSPEEQMVKQEQFALDGIGNNVKNVLSSKHNWDNDNYTLSVLHIDAKFIAGTIASTDPRIPSGVFLATNEDEKSIIFDSTTKDPCSLVKSGIVYPQVVTDMCANSTNAVDN